MKITLPQATWHSLLATVAPAVGGRVISALRCIKLTVGDDGLSLTATDTELAIVARSPVEATGKPGSCLVPFAAFKDLVAAAPEIDLTVTDEDKLVRVSGPKLKMRLPTDPVDQFPQFPDPLAAEEEGGYELTAGELVKHLKRTEPCANHGEQGSGGRFALKSVVIGEEPQEGLAFVGTDTRVLSASIHKAEVAKKGVSLVPLPAARAIVKAFGDPGETVRVRPTKNTLTVSSPRLTLSTRLIDGRHIPWADTLRQSRKTAKHQATCTPEDLYAALRQVKPVLDVEVMYRVELGFGPEVLKVSVPESKSGDGETEIALAGMAKKVSLAVDPDYLMVPLAVRLVEKRAEPVEFHVTNGTSPVIVEMGDAWTVLVMPLAD